MTGFDLIGSHQAGVKTLNNKHTEKTNLPLGAKKVLECDLHDNGIAVSYCFVLHFFCTQWQICFFSMFSLLLSAFYTRLMRPNKVETGRGLLT